MKRKKKNKFPAKYILLIMSILCAIVIFGNVSLSLTSGAAGTAVGYIIVPMQKGINKIGSALYDLKQNFVLKQTLIEENEELKEELEVLQEELASVAIDAEELESLKDLYDMDQAYSDYDKVAASVIAKDSGNWFSTFLVDKGTNDGVEEGMNVIADGALAGIVTEAGANYSKVRSIIDDSSNVSAKNLSTGDLCIVNGSLQSMNESSLIEFSDMRDEDGEVEVGDEIVVSNVSDMFLDGIPIGYITDITEDSNNLTISGHIATIVDFEHLDNVFIILQVKDVDTDSLSDSDSDSSDTDSTEDTEE